MKALNRASWIAALVLLAGCEGGLDPADVRGVYVLESVNGLSLPMRMSRHPRGDIWDTVFAGSLTLEADGSATFVRDFRACASSNTGPYPPSCGPRVTVARKLTWSHSGNTVRIGPYPGIWHPNAMSLCYPMGDGFAYTECDFEHRHKRVALSERWPWSKFF